MAYSQYGVLFVFKNPEDLDDDVCSENSGSIGKSSSGYPSSIPPVLSPSCRKETQSEGKNVNGFLETLPENSVVEINGTLGEEIEPDEGVELSGGNKKTSTSGSGSRTPNSGPTDPPDMIIGGGLSSGHFSVKMTRLLNSFTKII